MGMFERFTEEARRVIFLSRYEAAVHGVQVVGTQSLLMGILREDRDLMDRLLPDRKQFCRLWMEAEALFPKSNRKVSTTIDLPLSQESIRVLTLAADEAARRHHESIEPRHLLWGLFQGGGPETACLKSCGLDVEALNSDLDVTGGTGLMQRQALPRIVDRLPKERLQAAAVLLKGLAAGRFEAHGTGAEGPFHFSFGGKTE